MDIKYFARNDKTPEQQVEYLTEEYNELADRWQKLNKKYDDLVCSLEQLVIDANKGR
jgi:hypothetical protein